MEKKRSVGITVLSWYFIISGILGLVSNSFLLIMKPSQEILDVFAKMYTIEPNLLLKMISILGALNSFVLVLLGINFLMLKESWRKGAVYFYIYMLVYTLSTFFYCRNMDAALAGIIPAAAIQCLVIYFVTRPKVKEQFK